MADKTYQMIESVGSAHENIHSFEDIAKHHPTWKEDPKKRFYGELDGKREEFVFAPNGEKMLSKDIVFKVDGSSHVSVPSPFEGYAQLNEKWGTVDIYEQPNGKGDLIGRVRHMDPIKVTENQHVSYGEPLGIQGGKNGKDPSKPFGTHAHIDVSMSHLEQFKQYVKDVDSGVITTENYPAKNIAPVTDQEYHSTYDIKSEAKPVELTHPQLSKTAQTLITDATTHTKQWVSDNNREWNEQFNQAAHSVAHAAHKEGLTGINLFLVKDGEIHFAQRNPWGTNVASVDAKIASNTDVSSNLQAMADIDQTRAHSRLQTQEQALTQGRGRSV